MKHSENPRSAGSNRQRRRFQFSLRALLIVITVAGCGLAWLGFTIRHGQRQKAAVESLLHAGFFVFYDYAFDSQGYYNPNTPQPGWPCFRAILGDDFFKHVQRVDRYTDTPVTAGDLEKLDDLPQLTSLTLNAHNMDACVAHLSSLRQLNALWLSHTDLTDSGLQYLKALCQLKTLDLGDTRITDAGLEQLESLKQLEVLGIGGTKVTDAGLVHLEALAQLEQLGLSGTQVTDAGLAHIEHLSELTCLTLNETQIAGPGLESLKSLGKLSELCLNGTPITDAGLIHLPGFTHLKELWLLQTQVTDEGLSHFRKALPHCEINGL